MLGLVASSTTDIRKIIWTKASVFRKRFCPRDWIIFRYPKPTKLDERLTQVASLIQSSRHADIGSDHAKLIQSLLSKRQIEYGIAIENNQQPFQNSVDALETYLNRQPAEAEVRFGNGLSPLRVGEVDSLSICGLGGQAIVKILDSHSDRVPGYVVIQPNNRPEMIRSWALRCGFRILSETIVGKQREFIVLSFEKFVFQPQDNKQRFEDPAYQGVDFEAAILFGPLLIKRNDSNLAFQLTDELAYWSQFSKLKPIAAQRLELIEMLIKRISVEAV
jgi:tRNA (adenine22-N1)-methyltransferase